MNNIPAEISEFLVNSLQRHFDWVCVVVWVVGGEKTLGSKGRKGLEKLLVLKRVGSVSRSGEGKRTRWIGSLPLLATRADRRDKVFQKRQVGNV